MRPTSDWPAGDRLMTDALLHRLECICRASRTAVSKTIACVCGARFALVEWQRLLEEHAMVTRQRQSSASRNGVLKQTPVVFVISGGTGRTAAQVVAAATAQFAAVRIETIVRAPVRTVRAAMKVLAEAKQRNGVVCYTLVDSKLRAAVSLQLRELGISNVDILGPTLQLLGDQLGLAPTGRPGLLYQLRKEEFDRIDAVDFTLAHDDGHRMSDLHKADVILVGASRVSKSVTCYCLAARGVRAANVPLIAGIAPPPELLEINPQRIIGLTMNAAHLASIRLSRLRRITKQSVTPYTDVRTIGDELRQIRDTMDRYHWKCIDVSYKATEEVVTDIIAILLSHKNRTAKVGRATSERKKKKSSAREPSQGNLRR